MWLGYLARMSYPKAEAASINRLFVGHEGSAAAQRGAEPSNAGKSNGRFELS
jgi:hypothetical protein